MDFSEDRDRGFCVRYLGVLLLLTPLLCAQNPDELLVVRLPATQGYINRHATPLPLPTGEVKLLLLPVLQNVATAWRRVRAEWREEMTRPVAVRPNLIDPAIRKLRLLGEERSPGISSCARIFIHSLCGDAK
jgi:hypothetical protein